MIPTLHLPGEMIPGQFGPIRRVFFPFRKALARTMSNVGTPSVMETTNSMPAAAASIMASAANAGGTKTTEAFAPVLRWASSTVLKTGMPSRSEEHTSELQSRLHLVCRLLLEKKKKDRDECELRMIEY